MKKLILILLLFTYSITSHTQEEDSFKNEHSIGMNINSIVNSSDFGIFYSPSTPYTIIYRYNMKEWAFKAGFGGNFTSSERENDNNQTVNNIKNNLIDFRFGFDKKFMSKNRFSATAGADVIFRYSNNYSKYNSGTSNLSIYETKERDFGLGPTLTLDFKITNWISLSTEMSYYITRNNDEYTRNDNSTGNQDQIDNSKGWSSVLNKPTALYLNIRF